MAVGFIKLLLGHRQCLGTNRTSYGLGSNKGGIRERTGSPVTVMSYSNKTKLDAICKTDLLAFHLNPSSSSFLVG